MTGVLEQYHNPHTHTLNILTKYKVHSQPWHTCPGQRTVPVTGVRYNSLLWMCTLNPLTWPDLTWPDRDIRLLTSNSVSVSSNRISKNDKQISCLILYYGQTTVFRYLLAVTPHTALAILYNYKSWVMVYTCVWYVLYTCVLYVC